MAKSPALPVSEEDEMVEVSLPEANHGQLIWFCKMQGYEYDPAETINQTMNRIATAWEHQTITVPKIILEGPQTVNKSSLGSGPEDRYGLPEKVTVRIAHSGDDQNEEYENVAHNGVTFRIRKGVDVEIPWYVYKILDDAKEMRYTSGRDTGIGEARVVQAVPFSRVK